MLRLKKKKPGFIEDILKTGVVLSMRDRQKGMEFLISFFSEIRPAAEKDKTDPEQNLQRVTKLLYEHKLLLTNLQHALLSQLINTKLSAALTESGIPLARNFWQEFFSRIRHKVLPPLQDENDFLYVINSVFFKKKDVEWIESIPRNAWMQFFEAIGFTFNVRDTVLRNELVRSLKILSFQVAQLGLEREVYEFLPNEQRGNDTAFVTQNYQVHEIERLLVNNADNALVNQACTHLKKQISEAYALIEHIRLGYSERGASLNQTYIILILSNRLQRMQLIADILDSDGQFDTWRLVEVFVLLVRNEKRKNSIREFLSQGAGYLAYQIAEHKGSKGTSYITTTRKDYWRMIRSAMKGGIIISFIAIIKNLINKINLAPFPNGFLLGLNYSIGFVLIDNTGSTLATKQPAFTASAVAGSLDTRKSNAEPNLNNLALTVAKVSRSQIASFFGNLIIVFPLTYFLAWGYHLAVSRPLAENEAALKLLNDQHPWNSLALLYACFTGFFLFLSGIIAGYVQNKIQYGRIKERLKKHPALRISFSPKRLDRIAGYMERNAGALIGSIALGFFLGFAGIVGKIFGIPFDIRHITIAAGNAAIGVYGYGYENLHFWYLLTVFGGVLAIGFLNFFVSFSLAFIVAVKSRGIHFSQYPQFFRILIRYFLHHPMDFIRPRKKASDSE